MMTAIGGDTVAKVVLQNVSKIPRAAGSISCRDVRDLIAHA
jgi:hypothetical protein